LKKKDKIKRKYTNFKVVIRVRPPLNRELRNGYEMSTIQVSEDHKSCSIYEYYNMDGFEESINSDMSLRGSEQSQLYNIHSFQFDYIYD